MTVLERLPRRRLVVAGSAAALAGAAAPSLLRAATLPVTPPQTEGPFYPVELPSDRDADLVRVTGMDARAMGTVEQLAGVMYVAMVISRLVALTVMRARP